MGPPTRSSVRADQRRNEIALQARSAARHAHSDAQTLVVFSSRLTGLAEYQTAIGDACPRLPVCDLPGISYVRAPREFSSRDPTS
jgi:hypothetical protein